MCGWCYQYHQSGINSLLHSPSMLSRSASVEMRTAGWILIASVRPFRTSVCPTILAPHLFLLSLPIHLILRSEGESLDSPSSEMIGAPPLAQLQHKTLLSGVFEGCLFRKQRRIWAFVSLLTPHVVLPLVNMSPFKVDTYGMSCLFFSPMHCLLLKWVISALSEELCKHSEGCLLEHLWRVRHRARYLLQWHCLSKSLSITG